MHRVKGLEFDRVIITGVNAGTVPLEGADLSSRKRPCRRLMFMPYSTEHGRIHV